MADTPQRKPGTRLVQQGDGGGVWMIGAVVAILLIIGAVAWFGRGPSSSYPALDTTPSVSAEEAGTIDVPAQYFPAFPKGISASPTHSPNKQNPGSN